MIGIFGETRYTNALATRLVVRLLLPRKHGGVDAGNVIVIDGIILRTLICMLRLEDSMRCIIETYYTR